VLSYFSWNLLIDGVHGVGTLVRNVSNSAGFEIVKLFCFNCFQRLFLLKNMAQCVDKLPKSWVQSP